jgi:hypothetical protein
MNHNFKLGAQVKLTSFHGEKLSSEPVAATEDFWQLVGATGEVVSDSVKGHPAFPDKGKRALIKFDRSLDDLGLPNHNDTPNSLWIFISDLELTKE